MRVGFIQSFPVFGNVSENLENVKSKIEKMEANLIVLPELFSTGYQFTDREEALRLAEPVPGGPTTDFLLALAESRRVTLVAGLAEKENGSIYNSALVVGPDGYIGKYRKAHIFDTEKELFEPGHMPFPVFDIGMAQVGVMICFDWRFPETARTLALKGADIIAHPSNLVLPHCPQAIITRCLENRVFIVTADRVGSEERIPGQPLKFIGQSQVVDPDGNVLIRASGNDEETHVVEIDVEKARNKKINAQNDLFADRREELYRLH